jgi:hypothetical protein
MANRGEHFAVVVAGGKGVKDFVDAGDCRRRCGPANGKRFRHQ